jgi:ubiquinone/menaquinone biosynthesis C-methylase UbiE
VHDPHASLREVHRILKPDGLFILAFIDRETPLGKAYEAMKSSHKFYADATFYSTQQVLDLLHQVGFLQSQSCQTLFSDPDSMTALDPVRDGYGEGAFVVTRTIKQPKEPE